MTYPVSKTQLIASIRQRTNLEGATDFVDDIELGGYLNQAIAAWYDVVLGATWGGDRYQQRHVFQTVQNVAEYDRPLDLYKILSVDISTSEDFSGQNSSVWSAYPYQKENRNQLRSGSLGALTWGYGSKIWYRWEGSTLSFLPTPSAPNQFWIRLNYAPVPPRLEQAEDCIDVIAGWEEYLILHASIRALTKAGPYATIPFLQQQLKDEEMRIKSYAPTADTNQAERVHILESYDAYDVGSDAYNPWGRQGGW